MKKIAKQDDAPLIFPNPLREGETVYLKEDGAPIVVIEVRCSWLFIGEQPDGKRGIFYNNMLKDSQSCQQ